MFLDMSTLKGLSCTTMHINVFRLHTVLSCTWTCLDNRSLQCVPLEIYEILYEKITEFCEIPRNFRQFLTEFGRDGSTKNIRNSLSTEFRRRPNEKPKCGFFGFSLRAGSYITIRIVRHVTGTGSGLLGGNPQSGCTEICASLKGPL